MQLSVTVKLYMTKEQAVLVMETMKTYIAAVNGLVSDAVSGISIVKYTSKDVNADLPSALKNQCVRDANSIYRKYTEACRQAASKKKNLKDTESAARVKEPKVPVLRKPCCYINNQNYRIKDDHLEFPVFADGKTHRISVKIRLTDEQRSVLSGSRLGTMRIVCKNNKIVAQLVYDVTEHASVEEGNVMGVDLGIKCPAISYCSDGSVMFYGNGRRNKYMRRHFSKLRKQLQTAKHPEAVKHMNDKEQRIMRDIDHKISHDIIQTAVAHNVKTIKLECLANVRSTTRTSRKNNHSLHTWSFYRLAQYIEYKAKLAGIKVEYVNPAYTSQTCPVCGHIHHANDRNYTCKCGFHIHRDLLGAMNICNSTEYVGDSAIRHTA